MGSTLRDMLSALHNLLSAMPDIEFSVLVGSRAEGKARPESDWDIALQRKAGIDWMEILGKTETLRKKAADIAGVTPDKIDLIELRRACDASKCCGEWFAAVRGRYAGLCAFFNPYLAQAGRLLLGNSSFPPSRE